MRLGDYFRGYRVVMQSPLRREELERRIRAALLPRFLPLTEGVAGMARAGRVRLQFRARLFEYKMYPVLAGRIDDAADATRLDLRFRAPGGAYVFFALWYLAMLSFAALFLIGGPWAEPPGTERLVGPVLLLFFLLFPLLLHSLGTRRSDEHLDRLIEFLERQGEASLIEREGPRQKEIGAGIR